MSELLGSPMLRAILARAGADGVTAVAWADGEVLEVRYDVVVEAEEVDDGVEGVVVDVLAARTRGPRQASALRVGAPVLISADDLPVWVGAPADTDGLRVVGQVLAQLRGGSVWFDADATSAHDGLRRAIRVSGEGRAAFAWAVLGCLSCDELAVRTGAVAVLDEVAAELGADALTATLRASPSRFVGVAPSERIAFPDLEWAAVAAYQRHTGPSDTLSIAYFREIAEHRPWASWVLEALARLDAPWVLAHPTCVPHDHLAALRALSPQDRLALIAIKQPYPPERPSLYGIDPWALFPPGEAQALRAAMWPDGPARG